VSSYIQDIFRHDECFKEIPLKCHFDDQMGVLRDKMIDCRYRSI